MKIASTRHFGAPDCVFLGLVLVTGMERTCVLWDIFKTNQCCRYRMTRAGFVFLLVITAEFFNSIPVLWRFYDCIPLVHWVTKTRSDRELVELSTCGYCNKRNNQ